MTICDRVPEGLLGEYIESRLEEYIGSPEPH